MKQIKILLLILLGATLSCTKNNDEIEEITITISNFSATIDENPLDNESIGFVEATTNEGSLTYSITEQSLNNAIAIDPSSGEITVLTASLFDYENNPTITGIVKAENGDVSNTADILINLNDVNEIIVTASDLTINLDYIPFEGQILGIVEGDTNQGSVTFQILEQSPSQILQINSTTGELELAYFSNSIFSCNPMITALVKVSNGDIFAEAFITVNLAPICEATQDAQLLAFYPMNSNAMDESGFNNNGIVDGPVLTTDRFDNNNSAYNFDGNDDIIRVLDNDQIRLENEFTISAWIYPEEIKSQTIVRHNSGVNGLYAFPYGLTLSQTNDIIFSITTDGELTQARKSGYNINEWYLITGVFKNNSLYLYVNNELAAIETAEGDFNYNGSPLLIGTRLSIPSSTFKGKIDDVRIYDRALCTDEIINLFEN